MSKIKSKDFNNIKQLVELNLTNKQIFNITGFSEATIGRVKKQETWADYVKYKKEYNGYRKQQIMDSKFGKAMNAPIVTTVSLIEDKLPLVRIADALERLADAWEKQPEKKGWLK